MRLVLLRHGESTWNLENRFTGWTDVDLTPRGEEEAREAGRLMAEEAFDFGIVHTSVLVRAIRTADLALAEMNLSWLPVTRHWRLNERHYGALQGLDKKETAEKHGAEQVKLWRRSYDIPPDPLPPDDPRPVAGLDRAAAGDRHFRRARYDRNQRRVVMVVIVVFGVEPHPVELHVPVQHGLAMGRLGLEAQPLESVGHRIGEAVVGDMANGEQHQAMNR